MRRYCYAIQIRAQQQEHFAFGEFTIQDVTGEQQRHDKELGFQHVKVGGQQVKNPVARFKSRVQPVSYWSKRRSFITRSKPRKFSAQPRID